MSKGTNYTQTVRSYDAEGIGNHGSIVDNGTTAVSGVDCYAIQFTEQTTFSALTNGQLDATKGTGNPEALTYPAGLTIFGKFTAWTLASGAIIAYKNES